MSDQIHPCPNCNSPYVYAMAFPFVCPACGHEWQGDVAQTTPDEGAVLDANGNALQDGDSVVVIKNLPVKGSPQPIKAGTKVKNIRLKDGDHNIDCKMEGFGAMALKSAFVKKA